MSLILPYSRSYKPKNWLTGLLCALISLPISVFADKPQHNHEEHATEDHVESEEKFDPTELIMHHIGDAHDWHIVDIDGHAVSVALPVILWTEGGLVMFSSSEFHHDDHGHEVVEKGGQRFVKSHEHIYYAAEKQGVDGSYLTYETNEKGEAVLMNAAPLDFSITKNVASLFITIILICLLLFPAARNYKKGPVPTGVAGFIEPIALYLRDEVIRPNVGEKHYARFTPYMLSLFFFIWIGNMLGLVPFIPGGANLTGNIAFTGVLAVFTLVLILVNSNKHYWGHMLWMPGVPVPVKILLAPIELVGMMSKPFALMIRLFANMTAGHIIILSLISLIFIFETPLMSLAAVPLTLFIFVIKVFVSLLQAYIFVLLTSLFIGQAVAEPHH